MAPKVTPPAGHTSLLPSIHTDKSESVCRRARERHPFIPTSVWTTTTPSTAQASPPNSSHQKLLHLHVLGSSTWANGSWITSSFFHIPPHPSHPPANPVGSTLELHPEPDCILPLPCSDLLPAQGLRGAGHTRRWSPGAWLLPFLPGSQCLHL